MKARNLTVVFLGIVLMAASVLGVVFVGQLINPPATPLALAAVEIPAGTVISKDLVKVDSVQVNPKVAASHVREAELDQFIGSMAVEPIHQYSYIPKSALSHENNPAASRRLALALADPKLVAMVVPVDLKTAPDAIVEGDYIDLDFGALGDRAAGSPLTTRPTEAPGLGFGYNPIQPAAEASPTSAPEPTATRTATPEPLLVLPVAKTIVSQAKVLWVVRDVQTETQIDTSGQAQTVATPGRLLALVLAVPREAQELVQFAIDNGSVRVALLSAQIARGDPASRQPTLGMTWNDLVSLMRMEREAALATATPPSVLGPGAYALEATRNAATQAGAAMTQAVDQATQQAARTQTPGAAGKTPEPTSVVTPTPQTLAGSFAPGPKFPGQMRKEQAMLDFLGKKDKGKGRAETYDASGSLGVIVAGPLNVFQPFMALGPGNPSGVQVVTTTRDAADLASDVVQFKPHLVLLSPQVRGYTPDLVRQLVNWPAYPVAVVGLVPSTGTFGAEMAGQGAVGFYNTPVVPSLVEKFAQVGPSPTSLLPGATTDCHNTCFSLESSLFARQ